MKKLLQTFVAFIALLAFAIPPLSAQEYGMVYTRGTAHITTKTTTHVATKVCTLYTMLINVSNAGTTWTITVQDLATTPQIIYTGTVAVGTTVIALPIGIKMDGGIDIVTAGTTAGVMDVKYAFR